MKVVVTRQHILDGKKVRTRACPVALALRDSGWKEPVVGVSICWEDGVGKPFVLPLKVQSFTNRFDNGLPVEPFEFELSD
jgi:hypothetical protein